MRIVIDPLPVLSIVYRPENAWLALHRPDEVQPCTRVMWSGLAQTKRMDLIYTRHTLKEYVLRQTLQRCVVKTMESSEPELTGPPRFRVDLVLTAPLIGSPGGLKGPPPAAYRGKQW